jgi:mannose-6-phosphate isomerase-like protein (cupin superfamily)
MADYTHKQLTEVKDSAPEFGIEEIEARFAKDDLDAADTGLSHHRMKPGARQPFGHKHGDAEEIYVVISGSGRIKLDDDIVEIETLDAIRIAPEVVRALEAGPEGIEVLAVGPRRDGDGELLQNWWTD